MKKNVKLLSFLVVAASVMTLASCNASSVNDKDDGNEEIDYIDKDSMMLSPAGAPNLAVYSKVLTTSSATTTTPSDIPVQLQDSNSNYNYVVFDAVNALKLIKANKAKYTFLGLLTSGNYHLVGYNQEENAKPAIGDHFVSFGKGLMTDEVMKYLVPEAYETGSTINYLEAGVSAVAQKLIAGADGDYTSYWALVAEPALHNVLSKNDKVKDYKNCTTWVKEKTEGAYDFIPQGGLFVKTSYYESSLTKVTNFMTQVKKDMTNAIESPATVVGDITKNGITSDDFTKKFGFGSALINPLQKDNANLFGISNPDGLIGEKDAITSTKINEFLTEIGSASANRI
jgi:hypothetical protein